MAARMKERCWINIWQLFSFSQNRVPIDSFWPRVTCQQQVQSCSNRLDDPFLVIFRLLKAQIWAVWLTNQISQIVCGSVLVASGNRLLWLWILWLYSVIETKSSGLGVLTWLLISFGLHLLTGFSSTQSTQIKINHTYKEKALYPQLGKNVLCRYLKLWHVKVRNVLVSLLWQHMAKVNKRLMWAFDIWQPSMISSLAGHRIRAQNRQIWLTLGTISVWRCTSLSL